MSINCVVISGNLAAEPTLRGSDDNKVLSFPLAVNNRVWRDGGFVEEVFYMQCSIFGKRAKAMADILRKGMPVTVDGHLKPSNYEKDGKTVYGYRVNVDEIQLPPKRD